MSHRKPILSFIAGTLVLSLGLQTAHADLFGGDLPLLSAIVNNSKIKIFLRHDGNHDTIINYFKLSKRAAQAFRQLAMRPGHYSDFLLLYGQMLTTVRLALHPLAYWILTTDADDRHLIERAAEKNAWMNRLELLTELANRYPHGALRQAHFAKTA